MPEPIEIQVQPKAVRDDGSVPFVAPQAGVAPVAGDDLVTKGYADTVRSIAQGGTGQSTAAAAFAALAPDAGGEPGAIVTDGSAWFFVSAAGRPDGDVLMVDSGEPSGFRFGTPGA